MWGRRSLSSAGLPTLAAFGGHGRGTSLSGVAVGPSSQSLQVLPRGTSRTRCCSQGRSRPSCSCSLCRKGAPWWAATQMGRQRTGTRGCPAGRLASLRRKNSSCQYPGRQHAAVDPKARQQAAA
uniref:Putative secreted protein n=1 Tax=Ixodes ricinus TaxID=34613 RepID=A0A6B0UPU8_IXORI